MTLHMCIHRFTLSAYLSFPLNRLCLGRLAYRGYLFGLDERVTEKVKQGFAFRMSKNVDLNIFVEFLPRLCRWGFQGWFTGSGLYRRNWLRLTPALTRMKARLTISANICLH